MNNYCRRSHVKAEIGKTTTVDDSLILRAQTAASRGIDKMLNHPVFSAVDTRYLDGDGGTSLISPWDIISLSALNLDKNDDGVFETALVESTDYYLYDYNNDWKWLIKLRRNSFPNAMRSVQLVGRFGYSAMSEDTGQTVQNATEITAGGTALTVVSTDDIDVGEVLVLGTEEVYVSAKTPTGLTIQRAVNGTTAAAHANGVAISRRRYPEDIEEACRMQVARFFREKRSGGQMGDAETGGYAFSSMWPAIRDLLGPHIRHVVG